MYSKGKITEDPKTKKLSEINLSLKRRNCPKGNRPQKEKITKCPKRKERKK